jgi:predicted nucleic acid-binding protein
VRAIVEPLLLAGRIATCGIVELELLYSAVSPGAYAELALSFRGMPRVPITEEVMERSLEVQAILASRSLHRSVTLPDLLVAACAEANDLTVLHYNSDFVRIADVTGQSEQWVVPQGSVS